MTWQGSGSTRWQMLTKYHAPSFLDADLPEGTGRCISCGLPVSLEDVLTSACPGRPSPEGGVPITWEDADRISKDGP